MGQPPGVANFGNNGERAFCACIAKELARWSNAVDRHLGLLLEEGRLEKVGPDLYMAPRQTRFGPALAQPEKLVGAFSGTTGS
jgi:hypothetical protein